MYTWYIHAISLLWHISKSKQNPLCSKRVWPQTCLLPGPILNPSGLLLPMISSQVKMMIGYTFHARNMVGMMVIFFFYFGDLWHIHRFYFGETRAGRLALRSMMFVLNDLPLVHVFRYGCHRSLCMQLLWQRMVQKWFLRG